MYDKTYFLTLQAENSYDMTLDKEEFKTLVMLYAANIDGNIQSEEVKIKMEKSGFEFEV